MDTQSQFGPPHVPTNVATGFADDEIRELGDKIADLTPSEAKNLMQYIRETHQIETIFERK